jgi:hypothetical protein
MSKFETTEDAILETLLVIILSITIGVFMYTLKFCSGKESCRDSQKRTEKVTSLYRENNQGE